jgi:uncharacterized membrane protein
MAGFPPSSIMPNGIYHNADERGVDEMSSRQNVLGFYFNTPNEEEIRAEGEYVKEKGRKAPRKEPGDRFPIAGALIGIAAGFITGIVIGGWAGIFTQVICTICGGITGTVVGSLIRSKIANSHGRNNY